MDYDDYTVYKQRWIILIGVMACSFIRGYLPSMFAITNDIMSAYLRITPLQADILTTADNIVAVFVCLGTAVFGNQVGVRLLSLTTAMSFVLCSAAVAIAITGRDLYILMLSGRLVSGISAALFYILPPILANAWFRSSRVATVASLPITFACIGSVVSPTLYSNLLPKVNTTVNNSTTNSSLAIQDFDRLQKVVIYNMAVFLTLSLTSTILFWFFAANHPPSPPSRAQHELFKHRNDSERDVGQNFRILLKILKLPAFWTIVIVTVVRTASVAFSLYLQPSLLKASFTSVSNAVVGYCAALTTISCAVGSAVAGKVLDKWKSYKYSCLFGFFCSGGSCVAIYFSHVYQIIELFFIFHAIFGFLRLFIYICMVELLLEVTYPLDRTVSTCLFFAWYNLSSFLWTPVERWVMVRFGVQYLTWVVFSSQVIAGVVLCLSNSEYKRTEANKKKLKNGTDLKIAPKLLNVELADD